MSATLPLESRASRVLRGTLTALAVLFWTAACSAVLGSGVQFTLGPMRVSGLDASRTAFQAALATAVALACWRAMNRTPAVMAVVAAVIVTGAIDAVPRRVGDGGEYMAMTLRMADGHGPTFDDAAVQRSTARLQALGWLHGTPLTGLVPTTDGRQVFLHFWLYSALVAPVAALTEALDAHPNLAFTLVNATLLLALVWRLSRSGHHLLALIVGIGPVIWWVDKAHSEVFMVATIGAACLLAAERRRAGFLAAGLAAAQNPGALGPLVVSAGALAASQVGNRRDYLALTGGVALAAIYPAHYLLHTGRLSPLLPPDGLSWPGLRTLLTPLVDLNVGLWPFAPAYCLLVAAGLVAQPARTRVMTLTTGGLLLFAAAQAGNVNHGGTPGMSRYALWLFAALLPAAAVSARRVQDHAAAAAAVVGITAVMTWAAFRPVFDDGRALRPTILASAVWAHWPGLDNPVPEVFAERTSGWDGAPPVPATDVQCRKVLTVGTGTEALFPFPCEPLRAPDACTHAGALGYANAGRFSVAPFQRGFAGSEIPERSWTLSTRERLAGVSRAIGNDPRTERLGRARMVVSGRGIDRLWIVEGRRGAAIWVYPHAGYQPELRLTLARAATVAVQDTESRVEFQRVDLPAGEQRLVLNAPGPLLVIATMPGER